MPKTLKQQPLRLSTVTPNYTTTFQSFSLPHNLPTIVTALLSWYTFSALLSLYNKHLLGRNQLHLSYPLLITAVHTGLESVLTWAWVVLAKGGRERWVRELNREE